MKIVYFMGSLCNPGGMERVITTKANALAEMPGYEVTIAVAGNDIKEPFFALNPKVRIYKVGSYTKNNLSKALAVLRPDVSISVGGNDIRHLPELENSGKTVLELHFTRNFLVYLIRGIKKLRLRPLHLLRARYYQWREKHYGKNFDRVVLLTEQDKRSRGNKHNMASIPNPLSFESKEYSSHENKRVIACGRLIAQKGFDLLIEAYSKIAGRFPEWKLEIYGEGQDEERLVEMVRELNLEGKVSLHRPVKDIKKEMLNADIFAFSSRYEGFGLVLTEAMECGLPCVSFDCECGPSEIISDGIDGVLVPNECVKQFADSLAELMGNDEKRKLMGKKAKENVRRFKTISVMKQWDSLFKNLMEE